MDHLVGVELSPPRPVRPLGKAKFNYNLNYYCKAHKILVPAAVAEGLEVTRVCVGEIPFQVGPGPNGEASEVEFRAVKRDGALIGYEMIIPEAEATSGQQISVSVTNKTRKVVLFYMIAVLAILDEQKLLAATIGQVAALPVPPAAAPPAASEVPPLSDEDAAAFARVAGAAPEPRRMKRFVVLTCLWKRPVLARIVLDWYSRQRARLAADFERLGFDVYLLAVGSEGAASRALAEDCGWHYIERPNQPLSDKWNSGIGYAHNEMKADATYIIGSDDLSSDAYMVKIAEMMADGADHAGVFDCYLASPRLDRTLHILPTMHTDKAIIGAGRAVSRDAIELCGQLPYEPGRGWGIDPSMDRRLQDLGVNPVGFVLEDVPGAMLLDVKTSANIWPFRFFRDMGLPEPYDEVLGYFGEDMKRELAKLKDDGEHELDQYLDPLLHRIAASLLSMIIGDSPTIVEIGRKFESEAHIRESIPGVKYVTKLPEDGIEAADGFEPADGFVIFDGDLSVADQMAILEKLPHNSHVMISVPQFDFESYTAAEAYYSNRADGSPLLANFSIKVVGRWWLGCGTKVGGHGLGAPAEHGHAGDAEWENTDGVDVAS